MKTSSIFIIYIVLTGTQQQCVSGCLKCATTVSTASPTGICQLCDITQNLILSGTGCIASNKTNCLLLDVNGNCLVCASNFYLDPNSKSCIAVATASQIQNCIQYSGIGTCSYCSNNMFILNNVCTAVPNPIANCALYNSSSTCFACTPGNLVVNNGTQCNTVSGNCIRYTNVNCFSCLSGYTLNENFGQYQAIQANPVFVNVQAITSNNLISTLTYSPKIVCQQNTISGCKAFATFNTCATCNTGSFLTSTGSCQVYPISIIPNCQIYINNFACSSCIQGFLLASSTQCNSVTAITNCNTYSTTINTTQCISCIAGYFVSGNGCVIRVNSLNINNCLTLNNLSDTCAVCNPNYQLTSDNLACLPVVINCASYVSSTFTNANLVCNACANNYYLTGSTCTLGTVAGCLTYQVSSNICLACDNLFYANGGQCVSQPVLLNCINYSITLANTCTKCNFNSLNFQVNSLCIPVTTINGCSTYTTATNCSTCSPSFYLTSQNTCLSIPTPNCLDYNATSCIGCAVGYALISSLCWLPNLFQSTNCSNLMSALTGYSGYTGTTGFQVGACASCNQNSYEINMAGLNLCIPNQTANQYLTVNGGSTVTVNNCLSYTLTTAWACSLCNLGYYLDPTTAPGVCLLLTTTLPGCGTGLGNLNTLSTAYSISLVNTCITAPTGFSNCLLSATNVNLNSGASAANPTNICLVCQTGFVPKIVRSNIFDFVQTIYNYLTPNTVNQLTQVTNPVQRYPATHLCIAVGTAVAGCSIYRASSECIRCQETYLGTETSGRVTQCDAPNIGGNTCAGYQQGLDSQFVLYTTCTKCQIAGQFVQSYIKTTNGNTVTGNTYGGVEEAEETFLCNIPSPIIPGCQVYAQIATDDVYDQCIGCQPGFQRTLNGAGPASCTAIANCSSSSTWLNYCSQCLSGFMYQSLTVGQIQYDVCVTQSIPNCYAGVVSPPSCNICMPGYMLTFSNVCETANTPNCTNFVYQFKNSFPTTAFTTVTQAAVITDKPTLNWNAAVLAFQPLGPNCFACATGFTLVKNLPTLATLDLPVCIQSSVLASGVTSLQIPPFIQNCANYQRVTLNTNNSISYSLRCLVCQPNYIPDVNNAICSSISLIPNCSISVVNSNSLCSTCAIGFFLVSGACQRQNIALCLTYNINGTCLTCNNGFYLSNNVCLTGTVHNCAAYSTSLVNTCITCLPGYVILYTLNNAVYCIFMDPTLNCAAFTSQLNSQQIYCTKCNLNTQVITSVSQNIINKTTCLPLNIVNNCVAYNIQSTVINSTYFCTTCAIGFYLNNLQQCVTRQNQPANCLTYNPTADQCLTCGNNSFVSTDGTNCLSFPNGIFQCSIYSNQTTCTQCNSPYYLSNNLCVIVTPLIANCNLYSTNSFCIGCVTGFAPINGVCVTATAQNCLTYTSASACATCNIGFGLSTIGINTNCVAFTDTNCSVSGTIFPFICTTCKVNFYPNTSGVCTAVPNLITSCVVYDSATTCLICNSISVLAIDRLTCNGTAAALVQKDSNCNNAAFVGSPICSTCAVGYYYNQGNCVACPSVTGCMNCNPLNTSQCLICSSGFYQNSTMFCVSSNQQSNSTNLINDIINNISSNANSNNNNNDNFFINGTKVLNFGILIATFVLFMIQ